MSIGHGFGFIVFKEEVEDWYSLLAHDCASALESVGLDAYVGFLHRDRPGRGFLALDLMEELRPCFADRFVLTLVNNRAIKREDFDFRENGTVLLTDDGRKVFLQKWQERKRETITHPFLEEKLSWGLVPYVQSLLPTYNWLPVNRWGSGRHNYYLHLPAASAIIPVMKTKTQIHDMTQGPLLRQMIVFTLPLVLANLLQTLYTLADLAVVGHFAGSEALAAVSVSGQVTIFFTLVGANFASGGQIYVAQLIGQKRRDELGEAIGTILSFILLCSLAVAALGIGLCRPALGWLNTPAEAFDEAADYLRICSLGLIFLFGYNAVCAVLRGMGESKAPTWFIAVSAVVNIIGDLLLVAVFGMGAAGAAIATAVSQAAAFALALWYLIRRSGGSGFTFRLSTLRICPDKLRVIVKLALPLVLMQISIHLSMLYISAYINSFGLAAASLSGVGNKLNSLMTMVSGAFGTAMATIVGQNIGAGQYDRIRRSLGIATAINLAVFLLFAALVLLFPEAVFRLFTDDEEVLSLAPHYLRIAVWSYLFFSLMSPPNGVISGVGNTMLNLGISILDGVVARVGLSLLLGRYYGMWGYFAGYCLAGAVSVILGWAYVLSGRWTRRKLLE